MTGKRKASSEVAGAGVHESPEPLVDDEFHGPTWGEWLRQDFLRAWFILGSLAWDGFGAIQVRYFLDPYRPDQGPSSAQVYLAMLLFAIVSIAAEAYLYSRWWPREPTAPRPPLRAPLTEFEGWRFWRRF